MSKTIGVFDFELSRVAKTDDLPLGPIIHLYIKSYGGSIEDGTPSLSSQLMTELEIDEFVRSIKADLDVVAKKAKDALALAKVRTKKLVAERQVKK